MTPSTRPATAARRSPFDVAAVRARLPDPAPARCTASRSSISTTPPRRRSRGPCIDAIAPLLRRRTTPTSTAASTLLSERATAAYEGARAKVRALHQRRVESREIVFTRNATEGINLVAQRLGRRERRAGRRGAHHRRWSTTRTSCRGSCCASATGATLRVVPIDDRGELRHGRVRAAADAADEDRRGRRTSRTRSARSIRSREIVALAHARGVAGAGRRRAGGVPHAGRRAGARLRLLRRSPATSCTARPASACSTAARPLLEAMPPFQGGGDMIALGHLREDAPGTSCRTSSRPARRTSPARSGLGAAIDYVDGDRLRRRSRAHEADAARRTPPRALRAIPGVRLDRHGARTRRASLSFVMDGVHPHDIGTILDREGVAIRTGHHCAQPVMDRFGIPATARASFAMYNTRDDIDALVAALGRVRALLG